jgi:hypothetical protein
MNKKLHTKIAKFLWKLNENAIKHRNINHRCERFLKASVVQRRPNEKL